MTTDTAERPDAGFSKICQTLTDATTEAAVPADNTDKDSAPRAKRFWGSKRAQRELLEFFARNRFESLSIADAAAKLGVNANTAAHYLSSLAGEGILKRVSVYVLAEEEPQP
jgi:Fic family protein